MKTCYKQRGARVKPAFRSPHRRNAPQGFQSTRAKFTFPARCSFNATYIDKDVTGVVTAGPGPVIINGHVSSDGVVHAANSVVVLGTIQGVVHAGMMGDRHCSIRAFALQTDQLQICDVAQVNGPSISGQVSARREAGMVVVSIDDSAQALRVEGSVANAQWSRPALLAAITGGYAILAGLALTAFPLTVFGLLFSTQEVTSGWIRVGGILFTLIGMQYLGTAVQDHKGSTGAEAFYSSSVWSRLFLVAGFVALVLLRQVTWGVALLAAINAVGALSMLRALQLQRQRQAAPAAAPA